MLKKQSSKIIDNIEDIDVYYKDKNQILIKGDSFCVLPKLRKKSIDMIFADPPYFLSGDGITCSGGKVASVKKGKWDEKVDFYTKHEFNKKWLLECKRILKDDGTIWISGTMHNIFSIGVALEELGYKIINNITWRKTNPPPNISNRAFTHSTENIIWAKKELKEARHKFNYKIMAELNGGKQAKDVWETSVIKKSEKQYGYHPTQKPKEILGKIILSSTDENQIVLDPFGGSGTTGVVCKLLNRKCISIEKENEYLDISVRRFKNEENF